MQSTIQPDLQLATELALQEGLASFELRSRRLKFDGPEANLTDAIQRIEEKRNSRGNQEPGGALGPGDAFSQGPTLKGARLPVYDVHWSPRRSCWKAKPAKSSLWPGAFRIR